MGQFSWITCDTKEQVINNEMKDVYKLHMENIRG